MATTPIEVYAKPGKTLTVSLFARGNDTAAVSGRSLTEATNRDGVYECNVTEALSGRYKALVYEGTRLAALWDLYMADTTTLVEGEEIGFVNSLYNMGLFFAGLNDLSQANVRSAVGLASANLDTQLGNIPTVSEMNARTVASATYATQAKQNTAQADLDIITGSDGVTLATTQGNYAVSTFDPDSDTVDVGKINGAAVTGDGTSGDKWRGA